MTYKFSNLIHQFLKKATVFLLIGTCAMGLTACTNPFDTTTAKDLITSALVKDVDSLEYRMLLDIESETQKEDKEIGLFVTTDFNIKQNTDIDYIEGKININVAGKKSVQDVKVYNDYFENKSYFFNKQTSKWTENDLENKKNDKIIFPTAEQFQDLTLNKNKNKTSYLVTGKLDADIVHSLLNATETIENMAGISIRDKVDKYEVTLEFDKQTKELTNIYITPKKEITVGNNVFSNYYITLTFTQINSVELSIPEDVKRSASETIQLDPNQKPSDDNNSQTAPNNTDYVSNYGIGKYSIQDIRDILPDDINALYNDEELYNLLIEDISKIRIADADSTKDLTDEEVLEVIFIISGYMDNNGNKIN